MEYNKINIIKIQRCYRGKKIKELWKHILIIYDLYNKENRTFYHFSLILKNKELLKNIKLLINKFNILKKTNINEKVFLSSFLISNFNEQLLGKITNRNLLDDEIFFWSKKLNDLLLQLLDKFNYFDLIKLINYFNNYNLIFSKWKDYDKNNTIQNIIISYYNRKKHIEYLVKNNKEPETILVLNESCEKLLTNIIIIDKNFDIEYFKNNYVKIYNNINEGLEKITSKIKKNYMEAYKEMLIDEFKSGNKNIILKLIEETNTRVKNYLEYPKRKIFKEELNNYNFTNILLKNIWSKELFTYINLLINQLVFDKVWKNFILSFLKKDYIENFPCLLIEINKKIDELIFKNI